MFLQGCALIFSQDGVGGTLSFFMYGFGGMFGVYLFLHSALSVTYVFAHEMTHLIVGLCFFARPKRFEIHRTEGCVELSKMNCFILLAPYCVPFYVLVTLGVQCVLTYFWPGLMDVKWWILIYGLFAGYHFFYTLGAILTVGQSDLKECGWFFSYWFILCVNLLLLSLPLSACSAGKLTFTQQGTFLVENTTQAYGWIYEKLQKQYTHSFGPKEV